MSTFTDATVTEVRRRYAAGGATYEGLAIEFQTTKATIAKIVTRKTWKHLA